MVRDTSSYNGRGFQTGKWDCCVGLTQDLMDCFVMRRFAVCLVAPAGVFVWTDVLYCHQASRLICRVHDLVVVYVHLCVAMLAAHMNCENEKVM